ncbi:putative methyltransferase-domain-containing protein [Trametes meyenii]|nr:putative methyltransferase-domain-containing protein [Trametes meyenii]
MLALPDPLFDVLRAYATLQPPKSIEQRDIGFNTLHGCLLNHILLNPHFQKYPPSKQYQVTFWKWAIAWLERLLSDEDEIDERIYTYHIDLIQELSARNIGTSAPSPSYVTYLWQADVTQGARTVYPGYSSATLLESRTTIESGTTGLRTWSASLVMAQYLLKNPELVQGTRVLELGCGAGFLGVIVASMQLEKNVERASLWLTDVNEPVLQRCRDNLRLRCNQSHLHTDVSLRALDWFDAIDTGKKASTQDFLTEARPDVVLGADVVYDPSIIPPLVHVLALALRQREDGTEPAAYIALTERNENTLADFLRHAGERDLRRNSNISNVPFIEDLLAVETITTELVSKNIFTGSTELGQASSTQKVKIFKIRSKT